ncbi:MAG: hypothetical protein DRG71_10160 [Deltaproteobacteria bacterium]|nr:MAG: hypothetical protein DRG71_10160 [Deltaproteobacteria bacterium]
MNTCLGKMPLLLFCVVLAGCDILGSEGSKTWIVGPGASFSAGKLEPSWPICPTADDPLACPENAGCYPAGCP